MRHKVIVTILESTEDKNDKIILPPTAPTQKAGFRLRMNIE